MGDGGSGGDPHNHGQNTGVLLGKLLRLDVDHGAPYRAAPGNPFTDGRAGRSEIWAVGLRNPWRVAFDRARGLLYIADVGQNRWEEIDVVRADTPGVNFGWRRLEGTHCYLLPVCSRAGTMPPVLEYGHGDGCSVIGGLVYRGRRVPALAGHYLYSDYCGGWLRSFRYEAGRAADLRTWDVPNLGSVLSFGEDADGEVYILTGRGDVYRIEADSASR
jgi:glucose/arabinose dehydrogenase